KKDAMAKKDDAMTKKDAECADMVKKDEMMKKDAMSKKDEAKKKCPPRRVEVEPVLQPGPELPDRAVALPVLQSCEGPRARCNQGPAMNENEARDKLWKMIKDIKFAMFTTRRGNGHLHAR